MIPESARFLKKSNFVPRIQSILICHQNIILVIVISYIDFLSVYTRLFVHKFPSI